MNIKWIGCHPNNFNSRYGNTVNKVILHWIVGSLESADATFNNPTRYASAHYGVGDNDIHQYVKERDCAWHAGNLMVNRQSIGIENEGGPDIYITEATYKTCALLVKDICDRYNIPLDRQHILGHKEVGDRPTQCPGTLDIDRIIRLAGDEMTDLQKKAIAELQKAVDKKLYGNIESAARAIVDLVKNNEDNKTHIMELDKKIGELDVQMKLLSDSIGTKDEEFRLLASEDGKKYQRIEELEKIVAGYQTNPPSANDMTPKELFKLLIEKLFPPWKK